MKDALFAAWVELQESSAQILDAIKASDPRPAIAAAANGLRRIDGHLAEAMSRAPQNGPSPRFAGGASAPGEETGSSAFQAAPPSNEGL